MSRKIEELLTASKTIQENGSKDLWGRFAKVKGVILDVISIQSDQIHKDTSSFEWGGVDEGITDFRGEIKGTSNGVKVRMFAKGSSVENQPHFVEDDGKLKMTYIQTSHASMYGAFQSSDGRVGYVEVQMEDEEVVFEGYWLQNLRGELQLEQVINQDGVAFEADSLKRIENRVGKVIIPNSRLEVDLTKDLGYAKRLLGE